LLSGMGVKYVQLLTTVRDATNCGITFMLVIGDTS
jgi:hypothetical protein